MVTILFADVTSSTALGERLDPERLQEVLATYFGAMREEIEAEGGTVEKFIGDAVMAAFGVPTAHEDAPGRALRAALRMRERLTLVNHDLERRFGVTLQIRTGVNTGEVLAATNPPPGEPMVTGDAVNAAARLEQGAEPGHIVVAERTARAARGFRFRELGERVLQERQSARPVDDRMADGAAAGVHFVVFHPTSDDFNRTRRAMTITARSTNPRPTRLGTLALSPKPVRGRAVGDLVTVCPGTDVPGVPVVVI